MADDPGTWWVLEKNILIGMLHRARYGEDPDMLYIELSANATTTTVEDDWGDDDE